MEVARLIVYGVGAYFALGALVALPFVAFGISRTDPAAKGSSLAFRLLVLPGSVVLWPIVLTKWIRGRAA